VEAAQPFLQSVVVGVDVIEVIIRRLAGWLAGLGQDMRRDPGPSRESNDRRGAIAAEFIGSRNNAAQGRGNRYAIQFRPDRIGGDAVSVTCNDDRDRFGRQAAFGRFATSLARFSRQARPFAFERFQNERLVTLDDAAQRVILRLTYLMLLVIVSVKETTSMKSVLSEPHFHNEAAAFAYVEAKLWPNGPVCYLCGGVTRIGKLNGKTTRPGLYKCYACRKPFTVRMGTVFEASHAPMRVWLQVIYMICSSKKGISTQQLHRTLGGSMTTAWFLGHRVREAMKVLDFDMGPMGGEGFTVEADETYIGRKSTSRAFKPPGKKQAVFSLVERGGAVRSFHVPNVTAANLKPIIVKHAHGDSRFQTDESSLYGGVGTLYAYHGVTNHSAKEYVRDDDYTNTAEGYFSILKRGIYGVYQHVSEVHLKRYLAEFDFRYSNRIKTGVDDVARTDLAIAGARGKRLTYRTVRGRDPFVFAV
jgi:transposase-like protein